MIGNDIVSLAEARRAHRCGDLRFLNKVCRAEEQHLLAGQHDPERAFWTLWALKESTYKLEYRLWQHRRFAPKRYLCQDWTCGNTGLPEQGCIETPQGRYVARMVQHEEYVHAVVASSTDLLHQLSWGAALLSVTAPRSQSLALREVAQQALQSTVGQSAVRISARGASEVPQVWLRGDEPGPALSLSHHGFWGAYAFVAATDFVA